MKLILKSDQGLKAELFQVLLEENDIPVLVVDKTDTAYVMLGYKELFVREEDYDQASKLLEEFKKNNDNHV